VGARPQAGRAIALTDQVVTGLVSKDEMARRAPKIYAQFFQSGYNEQLLEQSGFELLRRDDLTADLAELARRHCAARAAHADALRASEGGTDFEEQNELPSSLPVSVVFRTSRFSPGSPTEYVGAKAAHVRALELRVAWQRA
jgi:hypothetical protein